MALTETPPLTPATGVRRGPYSHTHTRVVGVPVERHRVGSGTVSSTRTLIQQRYPGSSSHQKVELKTGHVPRTYSSSFSFPHCSLLGCDPPFSLSPGGDLTTVVGASDQTQCSLYPNRRSQTPGIF